MSPTTSLSRTRVGRRRPVLFLPTASSHVFAGRPHPRLPTIFLRPPFPPWRFDPAAFSLHGSLTITTGRRSSSTTTTGRRRCTATIRPAEELFHDNQAFSPAPFAAALPAIFSRPAQSPVLSAGYRARRLLHPSSSEPRRIAGPLHPSRLSFLVSWI
jgi:hypothetical protein